MPAQRKRRVPKLSFTAIRGIGWHVSFRDPVTGNPKKHRFEVSDPQAKELAERRYANWLADYLNGDALAVPLGMSSGGNTKGPLPDRGATVGGGSLLEIANSLLNYEATRVRSRDEPRSRGKIGREVYRYRCYYVRAFLKYMNTVYGHGAVGTLRVDELQMQDVERYNQTLVDRGLSSGAVKHAMQSVRHTIIRGGRPEHGQQTLSWNWESRDRYLGRAKRPRILPSKAQLVQMLSTTDLQGRAMIWTAIGLGFGPGDLSVMRVGQVDAEGYDLRRGKTGIERYGQIPPLVWAYLDRHMEAAKRAHGDLVFRSLSGLPLVSGHVNRVQHWWGKLRQAIGEDKDSMSGFYVLRHLGATEFGSRDSCSISEMRRWLGHATSSAVADLYMRPVSPEHRETIMWIRSRLAQPKLDQ